MRLKLEVTAREWSRHAVLLYSGMKTLLKYPDTLVRVELIAEKQTLEQIKYQLQQVGLHPELDLVDDWEKMDDVPQG